MAPYTIRTIGDPVLKQRASDVADVDGRLIRIIDDMFDTMYDAPGLGLAAPQVGIQKRFFVYDWDDDPRVLINPVIEERSGEWSYLEGCLSVPNLHFEIVRPKEIFIRAFDLDGNEITIEADELEARLFQHELDHLDGILLIEHLDEDQQRDAKRTLREMALAEPAAAVHAEKLGLGDAVAGLALPPSARP